MEAPVVIYGVYGFFGNALSNACKILGYKSINNADNEKIKQEALSFVTKETNWNFKTWHEWKHICEHENKAQIIRFSKYKRGRSTECRYLVNYHLFVTILLEGESEEIDKLIKAYTGIYPASV